MGVVLTSFRFGRRCLRLHSRNFLTLSQERAFAAVFALYGNTNTFMYFANIFKLVVLRHCALNILRWVLFWHHFDLGVGVSVSTREIFWHCRKSVRLQLFTYSNGQQNISFNSLFKIMQTYFSTVYLLCITEQHKQSVLLIIQNFSIQQNSLIFQCYLNLFCSNKKSCRSTATVVILNFFITCKNIIVLSAQISNQSNKHKQVFW
jgi:hypothetical protein